MENLSLRNIANQEKTIEILESKKQSIESAKFSSETLLKDESINRNLARGAGGFLGFLVFLNSISNLSQDIKSKKITSWTYSRTILDFTASGALIGFAINKTLLGISFGFSLGLFGLILELAFLFRNKIKSI